MAPLPLWYRARPPRRAWRTAHRRCHAGAAGLQAWLGGVGRKAPVGTLLSLVLAALTGILVLREVAPADTSERDRPRAVLTREERPTETTASRSVAASDGVPFDVYIVSSESAAAVLEAQIAGEDAAGPDAHGRAAAQAMIAIGLADDEATILRAVFDTANLVLPGIPVIRVIDRRDATGS